MRRLRVAVPLLLIVLGGCSASGQAADVTERSTARSVADRAEATSGSDASPGGAAVGGPTAEVASEAGGDVPVASSERGGSVVPCFEPVNTSRNTMPMEISVEPAEVGTGDTLRVSIRTEPDALIAVTAEFSDHKPHGAFGPPGRAAPDGTWVWAWAITPDVPPGPARVLVAAGKSGDLGATGDARFTVRGTWAGSCV